MKITYLTKKEGKISRRGDFGTQLTLNHASSTGKKKKSGDGVWEGEKRKKENIHMVTIVTLPDLSIHTKK